MKVIDDLKASTIDAQVVAHVSIESKLDTDDSTSYVHLKEIVAEHNPQVIPPKETGKVLPCVHLAKSNAKRLILDMYHSVEPRFMQYYLDGFLYNFNRRYMKNCIFDRLLIAIMGTKKWSIGQFAG